MGALVGALSKRDDDVVALVILMLQELAHRGTQGHEITTPSIAVTALSLADLKRSRSISSNVSIGRSSFSSQEMPILSAQGFRLVLQGRILRKSGFHGLTEIAPDGKYSLQEIANKLLRDFDGSYAFASASSGHMLVGRDPLGIMPLYYGENESLLAIASERKALWKIGINHTRSFPPGNLALVNQQGFCFKPVWKISLRPPKRIKMPNAVLHLRNLLGESTRERLRNGENIGIAFSGGLDSSIIARLVQESKTSAQLISVCLKGQPESMYAEKAAKALRLPVTVRTFSLADVEDALTKVLWLIEAPDVMKVSVAIPLFWSAQVASKLGCDILLAGQGADELFGGYHRYLTVYKAKGAEKVAESLFHDTLTSYETNFQRDEPLCTYHKIELCLPFVGTSVVRFALSLPVNLKIQSADDCLRKRILRRLAKALGIPAFIAERPKKAVQYSTGVDKALKSLARAKGLTLHDYISKVFNIVYPTSEGKQSEHGDLL